MASYRIEVKRSAAKELEVLPVKDRRRIVSKIGALVNNPRPAGCEKLSGREKYRLRQGAYRILYAIDDDRQLVTVVKVGHRRDVYR